MGDSGILRPIPSRRITTVASRTTGPKREPASYTAIAADMRYQPRQILFVSDVGAELDAARAAGMATALAVRPGNRDAGGLFDHPVVMSFAEIVT